MLSEIPILPAAVRGALQSLSTDAEFKSLFALAATALSYLLGADLGLVVVLLTFVALDYLTGVYAAYERGELSARVGLRGIVKKVLLFSIPVMANLLDQQVGLADSQISLRELTLWMLIANEGMSILENLIGAGVITEDRIPTQLRNVLEHLAKQQRERSG